jgi:cell shape-determining protein MreD
MNIRGESLINLLVTITLLVTLVGLQSSLWFQFFGFFPSPQCWIPFICYWAVYRNLFEGILLTYLVAIIANTATAMPISVFLLLSLIIFLVAKFIKERFFWNGATYLMFLTGVSTLLFPLFHFILSKLMEKNPISDLEIIDTILSSLTTALLALPIHFIMNKLDQVTHKEWPTDVGSGQYE